MIGLSQPNSQNFRMPLPGNQALWTAAIFFLVNFLLKCWHIASQPIALDEPFTIFWAQQSLADIWELAKHENNPPLHFVIQHFSLKWLGWSPFGIRFSSLLFSTLCGSLIWLVANKHFGRLAGFLAATAFLLSKEHIYHSHEGRTYALLSLLTLLALHFFLELVDKPEAWRNYLALALLNALLMYTHFLGFWVLFSQCIAVLFIPGWKKAVWRLPLSMVLMLLLYLPNLLAMFSRLQSVATVGTWVPSPHWRQLYGHINIFFNGPLGSIGWGIALAFVFFLTLRTANGWTEGKKKVMKDRKMLVCWLFFACMYGGIYLQSLFFNPAFIPRYLLFCSIPLMLALGASIAALGSGRLTWLTIPILGLAMLLRFDPNPSNDRDILGLLSYVESLKTPESILVIGPDYFDKTYAFHAEREAFQDPANFRKRLNEQGIYPASSAQKLPDSVLANANNLILIDADLDATIPGNGLKEKIASKLQLQAHRNFQSYMEVWHYAR